LSDISPVLLNLDIYFNTDLQYMPNGLNERILRVHRPGLTVKVASGEGAWDWLRDLSGSGRLCATNYALQLHNRVKTCHRASFEADCTCIESDDRLGGRAAASMLI
jgi:hypothetical protein